MALTFGDNISYQGKKPLDSRSIFKTIADMKAYSENYLPPLAMCQNEEDGKIYTYDVNNEVNETLGKWRVLEGSGSGTADVPIEKIKVNGELQTPVNKVVDITVPDAYDDTALSNRVKTIEDDYTKSSDIPSLSGYATETWINEQGFLTEHQDLSNYATKDELPSLDGYATESYVTEQISNIPSVDLTDYAKKDEIPDISGYITEEQLLAKDYADKVYVTEEIAKVSTGGEIDLTPYLNKTEATETYVAKESGKSLIADTEIERLASVYNYDDTEIRVDLANINTSLDGKLDKTFTGDDVANKILSTDDNGNVVLKNGGSGEGTAETTTYTNADYPSYTNVDLALDALFSKVYYVKPTCSLSASKAGGTFEMGTTITAPITFTWTTNKAITSQTLTDCTLADTSVRTAIYNTNVTADKTFTLSVSDGENSTSSSVSYKFLNKVYYGSASEPDSYDSAFILGLANNKFATTIKDSYPITVESGQFGYIACPKSFNTPSECYIGGFLTTLENAGEISFTNASGGVATYTILKTGKSGLGSLTMEFK